MGAARADAAPAADGMLGQSIEGEVVGSFYKDEDTGFGVVELDAVSDGDDPRLDEPIRCTGPLADVVAGQAIRVVGAWREHARYGPTFEITYYEQIAPSTPAGLQSFLRSERFSHIPDKAITRVLTVFGGRAGTVIETEPDRLRIEARLSEEIAGSLVDAWQAGRVLARLVRLVEPAGVPHDVVQAIHARYGSAAESVIADDPYRLIEVDRVRFAHADALARAGGMAPSDPRRLAAGARAAVAAAGRHDGHMFLPRDKAAAATARLLDVDRILAQAGVDAAIESGALLDDTQLGVGSAIYPPRGREREVELAVALVELLHAPTAIPSLTGHIALPDELTEGQVRAVRAAFEHPVTLLTGGPGTGKTRTVREIVEAAENADLEVALCAPTGRAAKRLEELVGRPATTIHRLLNARPTGGGGFVFGHGADDRLPMDVIIADEVSMCDTALARAMVSAVAAGTHLVLVGDPDQLPSVGPGDVLRDIIASDVVPRTHLTEIHRQAAGSRIVAFAREVNAGEVGVLLPRDGDLFLAEDQRDRIVERVVEAVATRAPDFFDVTSEDVQVIAPIYRGPVGVHRLNEALRERLNPAVKGSKEVAGLRAGDRVLQTRNDPDLDVANGDIGKVVSVRTSPARVQVAFPRGTVTYDAKQARDLTHAWCITVHKSQGGEWPVVVFVCDRSHRGMLSRNLLYTGATRAQRGLILAGQADAIRRGAAHDTPHLRHTGLAERLRLLAEGVEMLDLAAVEALDEAAEAAADDASEAQAEQVHDDRADDDRADDETVS